MITATKTRKADKKFHNSSPQDFIPIACHFNDHTLLTKDGELIQIIQINGINAEHISQDLLKLREILGTALQNNVPANGNFAFWIHTIRRKTNLDDTAPYNKLFPANLHNMWKEKNYWHDKFVNTLYISIIYTAERIEINKLPTIINALNYKNIVKSSNAYLDQAYLRLNDISDKILHNLEVFGARKLGIVHDEDESFSEPIFLYRRIVRLNDNIPLVPISDLSDYIATNKYAVGGDKIEVTDDNEKKFTAILSIREHHFNSSEAIDKFLQLPVELIATEIFYFIDKKQATSFFAEQYNFLRISGDERLRDAKGLTEIMDPDPETKFCHHQIMISLMGDSLEKLDSDIAQASNELARIGIVHVREDINLEQTFWAQLPGNFSFLRRIYPSILQNMGALASLHNFPTGNQYNPWGKSVTLLRTEKGTPYFMNFHNREGKGNTGIFGSDNSGKTVLMNFMVSESTKFNPSILYITTNSDSEIFVNSIEGKWIEAEKSIINPFLLDDTPENRKFILEFLKLITNHYIVPLSEDDVSFLEEFSDKIFEIKVEARILSKILKVKSFSSKKAEHIKKLLAIFAEGGEYEGIFDNETNIDFANGAVSGINLYKFTDRYYASEHMPQDQKLMNNFKNKLLLNSSICAAITYALAYYHNNRDDRPKVLVLDEAIPLLSIEYFHEHVKHIFYDAVKNNGLVIANFSFEIFLKQEEKLCELWLEVINTMMVMIADVNLNELNHKLKLTKFESDTLAGANAAARLFLIKQDNESVLVELSIGGMQGILKILSSTQEDREMYYKLLQEYKGDTNEWLNPLYQALEQD